MPNLQQLLSEEIRRLARKEIRTEFVELKTQLTTMRKTIAEQNRRIKALEKIVPLPVKPQPSAEVPAEVKPVRITAARIKKLRDKLGFSQGKFAALLGVNLNSVRYWESGKIEPWYAVDQTGNSAMESLISEQLARNKLTSEGVKMVTQAGKNAF